jgi:hypothetical protein
MPRRPKQVRHPAIIGLDAAHARNRQRRGQLDQDKEREAIIRWPNMAREAAQEAGYSVIDHCGSGKYWNRPACGRIFAK